MSSSNKVIGLEPCAYKKAVTIEHTVRGAAWRQKDYDFFSSPLCAKILAENNIYLVTWREIRDKITRKNGL